MRLAFFGDVVGKSGREAVKRHLPRIRADLKLDAVVINAENAAGGLVSRDRLLMNFMMQGLMF